MIRRVTLTNYGPFASAELELSPLTVIVGPNASGKSKLLEILNFFDSSNRVAKEFLPGMRRKGSKKELSVEFESPTGAKTVWRTDASSHTGAICGRQRDDQVAQGPSRLRALEGRDDARRVLEHGR